MFDREGKRTEGNAAYEKAVDLGTASAYAYHRAAVLKWRGGAEPDQADEIVWPILQINIFVPFSASVG